MKCPKCRSERISLERRIDGDAVCMDCHHHGKSEEFSSRKPISTGSLPARKRWRKQWYLKP